jgi:hypothetical protein
MTRKIDYSDVPPIGAVDIDGTPVKFVVWAIVEAVLDTDKGQKRIPRLVGPVKLAEEEGLFEAMTIISLACEVPEFQADMSEVVELAEVISSKIKGGKEYKWE